MREWGAKAGWARTARLNASTARSFYFPGVLIGPSTRFVDYRAWSTGTLYGSSTNSPPAGRIQASLFELLTGIAYMAVWATLSPRFDYSNLISPVEVASSAKRLGPAGRIGYAQLAGLAARTKYYGIWTLTNVSILSQCRQHGLTYPS